MSDFNETAQRLPARLSPPASRVAGGRQQQRVDADEPREGGWAWAGLAAAGVVIAWLLSLAG